MSEGRVTTSETALGYLATPEAAARGGVVLVHDVWGLYDHFRRVSERLAQSGYATLAVNLYRRTPGIAIADPGAFMREMSDPDVLGDIQQAVDSLRVHGPVAVIGFCMGGMYALLAGTELRDVAAVAPFYGILSHAHGLLHAPEGLDPRKKPQAPVDAARHLRCPLLAFYGDRDVFVPMSDIAALREQLTASGQPFAIRIFEGAGHAFMNDTRPQMYVPEAAETAWRELLSFLHEHVARGANT